MKTQHLIPTQQRAFDQIEENIAEGHPVVFMSRAAGGRTTILRALHTKLGSDLCATLPPPFGTVDIGRLAEATEALTGADLKRVVEDGRRGLNVSRRS